MRIPTTKQIRSLEKDWIEAFDSPWGQVLMEIAGRGAAMRVLKMWTESPGDVLVLAGTGNNGGDGLVVARYLTLWGVPVTVCLIDRKTEGEQLSIKSSSKGGQALAESDQIVDLRMATQEGQVNKDILAKMNVPMRVIDPASMLSEHRLHDSESGAMLSDPVIDQIFFDTTLVIDAIFGTGLTRDVEAFIAA